MDIDKAIGVRLRALRKEKGHSHDYVKEKLGYAVGRAENGRVSISVSRLKQLLDFYGVSLVEFFESV